jgi:2-haloacid dehalogenase
VRPAAIRNVVFDLGGVLIDWDPRHLYRQLFDDEEAMERFLAEVTTPEWNAEQDSGRTWSEAVEVLIRSHPEHRDLITAYHDRWPEMLGGAIQGTVDVLDALRVAGIRVFALSNWSAETFPVAMERFEFLRRFDGIVISGEVRVRKPEAAIFRHLLERYELNPASTLFVDDTPDNVVAAQRLGLRAITFQDPAQLRRELRDLGLLGPAA